MLEAMRIIVFFRRAPALCLLAGLWLGCVALFFAAPPVAEAQPASRAGAMKSPPAPLYTGPRSPDGKDAHLGLPDAVSMPEAVQRALKFNPSLGSQESQSRSSEEARKSARGAFGPKLGMSYTAIKQERKSSPASSRPPELGTYSWAVEVSQPVFQGFRLLATYQKAALQSDSDKASLRKAELDMTEQVQTYFLDYLRAEENVRSERDSLARLRDQLRITKAFYDVPRST